MARITVDDCIKLIPNRFELTLAATTRARQLALLEHDTLVGLGADETDATPISGLAKGSRPLFTRT